MNRPKIRGKGKNAIYLTKSMTCLIGGTKVRWPQEITQHLRKNLFNISAWFITYVKFSNTVIYYFNTRKATHFKNLCFSRFHLILKY